MARRSCLSSFKRLLVLCVLGMCCGTITVWYFRQPSFYNQPIEKRVEDSTTAPAKIHPTIPTTRVTAKKHDATAKSLQVVPFPSWVTSDPRDTTFVRRVYLYSAFVALHGGPANGTDVHLVGFQEGPILLDLKCCARLPGRGSASEGGRAEPDFPHGDVKPAPDSKDLRTIGMVFRCRFPTLSAQQLGAGHVTLVPSAESCPGVAPPLPASSSSSPDPPYVPVRLPERKPGGLAICGKVAYGLKLDARKLVEWFEVQRLLGVDKILIYDFNNTDPVHRVFSHYQKSGLLDLLPYKLPGRPWGRGMLPIVVDDESMPIWDCRLRLAGYKYVMGIDMDEVIMPRKISRLKPFFKKRFQENKNAAALFFDVQFFLYNWGPVDPEAPLMVLQFLNSTAPRWECYKYVYKPPRVHQASTHRVSPYGGYNGQVRIPSSAATILHFRECPQVWKSCDPPRITDLTMLRFKDDLVPRVQATNKAVGL